MYVDVCNKSLHRWRDLKAFDDPQEWFRIFEYIVNFYRLVNNCYLCTWSVAYSSSFSRYFRNIYRELSRANEASRRDSDTVSAEQREIAMYYAADSFSIVTMEDRACI